MFINHILYTTYYILSTILHLYIYIYLYIHVYSIYTICYLWDPYVHVVLLGPNQNTHGGPGTSPASRRPRSARGRAPGRRTRPGRLVPKGPRHSNRNRYVDTETQI